LRVESEEEFKEVAENHQEPIRSFEVRNLRKDPFPPVPFGK